MKLRRQCSQPEIFCMFVSHRAGPPLGTGMFVASPWWSSLQAWGTHQCEWQTLLLLAQCDTTRHMAAIKLCLVTVSSSALTTADRVTPKIKHRSRLAVAPLACRSNPCSECSPRDPDTHLQLQGRSSRYGASIFRTKLCSARSMETASVV
jgi:hypothetical protein